LPILLKNLVFLIKETRFNAVDGLHKAIINDDYTVSLQMQDVTDIKKVNNNYYLNTGSPHYVTFKEKIKNLDVLNRGKENKV
jgi:diaminopimelate epimerase